MASVKQPLTSLESTLLIPIKTTMEIPITSVIPIKTSSKTTIQIQDNILTNRIFNNNNFNNNNNSNKLQKQQQQQQQQNNNISNILINDDELIIEKNQQNDQLSHIVKTLLYFETRLKNDQKYIRQILYEKDKIINRQLNEIINIKKKYNHDTNNNNIIIDNLISDDVTQYCPKCRKNYYLIDSKNIEVQTNIDDIRIRRNNKASPSQSVEFASSSEEPESQPFENASFAEARRSKKYMSKRTTGTFSEYQKHRHNSIVYLHDTTSDQSEGGGDSLQFKNVTRERKRSVSYSHRINNLHGIKQEYNYESIINNDRPPSSNHESTSDKSQFVDDFQDKEGQFEITDDWYASASDVEDSDSSFMKPYGYNAVNPVLECVNQILLQQSMDGLLDGVMNASDDLPQKNHTLPRTKRVHFSTQNSMVQVPRNVSPPPPPPPPLISSSQSSSSSPITTTTISNRQLTSNKGHAETKNLSYDIQSIYSNEYEPIGSEHNSSNYYIDMESKLGQEDIKPTTIKYERSNTPPDLPPKPPNLMKFKKPSKFIPPALLLKPPSTPSIINGSTESEPDYCSISEINVKTINNIVQTVVEVHKACDEYSSTYNDGSINGSLNGSINGSLNGSVNGSVGGSINGSVRGSSMNSSRSGSSSSSISSKMSSKKDLDDESFADVPKLPNVAAIISPKKEVINKFIINQDNYITKSPTKLLLTTTNGTTNNNVNHSNNINGNINNINCNNNNNKETDKKQLTNILTDINNTKKNLTLPKLIKMSSISENLQSLTTNEDKQQMQAEFDWYNLDAEYGKSNQPDIIRASDSSSESEQFLKLFDNCSDTSSNHNNCNNNNNNNNIKIEYNLDEEYNSVNQPDIIKKIQAFENGTITNNNNNSLKRNIRTIDNYFSSINKNNNDSPKQCRSQSEVNYDTFLDESGLSTKPLIPRHKKFYYSGSFV